MTYDWKEEWVKDLEYIERNYSKEIEDYEKYFNKETFDKIINTLKEEKYDIKTDDFYDEKTKFLGTTNIIDKANGLKVYFKLFDFGSPDCRVDMEEYLQGKLYSLDIALGYDILSYEEIKKNYEYISQIKKIIDGVIEEIE